MIGIVVLDALQALLFDNSPIIKIRENNVGGSIDYIDKGIFIIVLIRKKIQYLRM